MPSIYNLGRARSYSATTQRAGHKALCALYVSFSNKDIWKVPKSNDLVSSKRFVKQGDIVAWATWETKLCLIIVEIKTAMCALIHIIFLFSMFSDTLLFFLQQLLFYTVLPIWAGGCMSGGAERENNRYSLSGGHLHGNTYSALTSCMKGERMGVGACASCCLRFFRITLDYSSPWRFYHLLVVMKNAFLPTICHS